MKDRLKRIADDPYKVFAGFSLILFAYGLALATPTEIFTGLKTIVYSPDILITDYIEIAGLGAAFVNSGIVMLMSVILLRGFSHEPTRLTATALLLAGGFAFFGKNAVNIAPILFGGFLFSIYSKKPFHNNVLAALFGATLAPVVSQMALLGAEYSAGSIFGIAAGLAVGITIGFIIEPLAKNSIKSHEGYNLYNVGFAAGILGVVIMSIFRNFGVDFRPVNILSSGNDTILTVFTLSVSAYIIIAGYFKAGSLKEYYELLMSSRESGGDYYSEISADNYLRMGIMGIFVTCFVLLSGTHLNGPIIGGIFTIVGFSCCGKKFSNIIPVMLGASIAAYFGVYDSSSTVIIIAILFSTCLCPIAEEFGWFWGMLAGGIHLAVSLNIGIVNGGLNLYNNGLAGGFVVMILVPLIKAFTKHKPKTE